MTNFTPNNIYKSCFVALSLNLKRNFANISFVLLTLFCTQLTTAQNTPHIGPGAGVKGGGDFSQGTINNNWAANNWSVDAFSLSRSAWTVSTGANGNATNCAYISSNWNAAFPTIPTHAYATNAAYKCHFFRPFTVPAGETSINLSFDYIANGETTAGPTIQDYLRVWLIQVGTLPGNNAALATSGTLPAGNNLIGTYNLSNSWTTANITIDPLYADGNTYRLVFEWVVFNTTGGAQFPAAIDNVVLTSTVPNNNCSGAVALTVNPDLACTTTTAGTTISASQSQVGCSGDADDDVWYKFVATTPSHAITVSPSPGTPMVDAVFQVFSGTCAGLTPIVCVNATSAATPETTTLTGLTNGATYYVRVYSAGTATGNGTFTICVTTPCVAPTSQASALTTGTVTETAYPATFTGTASGFLVIQSTSATPPSQPADGTLYTTTASLSGLGAGLTFVQSGASTSIPGTGLTGNTRYYYYIYAYNNTACGGPAYTTGGALSGNATTCVGVPTSVAAGSITNTGFTLGWVAPAGGSASAITYTVNVTSDAGYTTNVASSPYTAISGLSQVVTGLSPSTLYYFRILANNGCSSAYVTGSFTTTNVAVCVPNSTNCSFSSPTNMDMIVNVTLNTLNNTSSTCVGGGYVVYNGGGTQTTSLLKGSTHNISITSGNGSGTHGAAVWFDFNQNGLFTDAGEYFLIGNGIAANATITTPIIVPIGANTGNVTMRVRYLYFTTITSAMSCTGGSLGETEDYTVTLVAPAGCPTPVGQPTVLNLTPVNTTINGTFTASGGADSYLVLVSTSNTAPATPPTNGTSYTIGSTFAAGYTVVDTDGNTSFSTTGLTATTLYYFYIYSMNSLCTGGPLYVTASPLTGSATTGFPSYCTPTGNLNCSFAAGDFDAIANVTINTLNNSSSCNAGGYTVFAATGTQTTTLLKGGAYNLSFTSDSGTTTSHYAGVWFDFNRNGSFGDAGEFFMITTATGPNTTTTIPIYVPTTAATGPITMRVRYFFATTMTSAMSCTAPGTYGEVEDYTVTIATPTACNATTLTCGATIAGTTNGSTNYYANGAGCTQSNFGTWYTFVGDGNQSVITVTSPVGFDTAFSVASGVCGSLTNVTCVNDFSDIDLYSFNTTNGVTYYVFVSYWNSAGSYANIGNYSINRICAPPYNPCSSIPAISCGSVNTVTVAAGYGDYNYSCGFTADGREQIYTFTPAATGSYYISQTAGYNYIYYQYKLVSSGCNSSGWTCINGLTGVTTSTAFTLTGGLAYYIRIDPETEVGGTVSFTIGGKVWSGVTNTDWNTASNWIPNTSIPSSSDCVIIPNVTNKPVISGTNYNGLAGTLTVQNSAQLTVDVTNSITVTDKVTVNTGGTFTLNNSASLVQVNNVANSGDIVYKRDASIKLYDYVYWSSPVNNYVVNSIATPLTFSAIYKWSTAGLSNSINSNGGQGFWQNATGDNMITGKGYIAKAPSTFISTPTTFNGTFTGVPNNGDILFPIERGDITTTAGFFPAAPFAGNNGIPITNLNDNWNLAGNPYPSSIRASQFLFNNNTKIAGAIRLWKHGITPSAALMSNPYYTSYNMNYDGTNDYLIWNWAGASCCPVVGADLFIGAGQGFFIQMLDGPRATDNVTFNNSLRNASYNNSVFYRSSNNNITQLPLDIENLERNRIWLDINDGEGKSNRTLFGYIEGATMGNDNLFDCLTSISSATQIYSLIENLKFTIQGRSLPFNEQDEVPIGIDIKAAGNCSIGIGAADGLFDTQAIYLKDTLLNIIHDLKASPYQFTSEAGIIDDRFKVVYVNAALANPNFTLDNNVKVLVNNEVVAVSSNNLVMESVIVYNILGQELNTYTNINANYLTLSGLHKNNTTLLLKIKLQTGEIATRKVSY